MGNKKYKIILIILVIITIILSGYLIYVKLLHDKDFQDNNKEMNNNNYILSDYENTQLLNNLIGDWGICNKTSCHGLEIIKKGNAYYYTFYMPWSGGFRQAKIISNLKRVGNNKYEIVGYYEPTTADSIFGEQEAKEETITINIDKINSNIIIVNSNNVYEKITGDREDFYQSKLN